jgi:hypothetical protein
MSRTAIVLSVVAVVVVGLGFVAYQALVGALDPFIALYDDNCSVCHGENLEGTPLGMPLIGADLKHGDSVTIEFELDEIEQPVVDLTPSPAVSSFIFYEGSAFPEWQGNIIVGTLKATELYRIVLEDNKAVHNEILLKNLARIRDVETGPDGAIYLLLEHASGGQIVRLVPA